LSIQLDPNCIDYIKIFAFDPSPCGCLSRSSSLAFHNGDCDSIFSDS